MSMATDVTERQQSMDQLASAEGKFRRLVEQSVAGIFMIDEHKLIYGNPRAAEILGFENHEINNIDLKEIIDSKDLPTISEAIKDTISGGEPRARLEFNTARHRGENVRVGAQGSSATQNGKAVVLGVMQDISEKSRTDAKITKYIEQLKSAFMSTVNVAMSIGEMRDPYTAGHEREVSRIAVAIATEMGLLEDQIEGIRVAGLLHDIGKISIPSEILAKPGRLTPTELELVKTHAQSSYELLKPVDFPWPVAEIAWEHHERMDGSGYPRGIKGQEILLEARILAVADVVEAMSSHRPYRASPGLAVALAEIRKGAGKIYDENVATACLLLFEEKGLEINQ
jgi:PAS domain S-box-containing protein/putative nucleotidyltransferase with HDIG domain